MTPRGGATIYKATVHDQYIKCPECGDKNVPILKLSPGTIQSVPIVDRPSLL
jgi:hypothetical protein